MAYDVVSVDGLRFLLPELVLVSGILALFIITNIGDAKIRLPLTRLRIPALLGGNRFKWNSDPRLPGVISVFIHFCNCNVNSNIKRRYL